MVSPYDITSFVSTDGFEENAYILSEAEGGECLVIDPGASADRVIAHVVAGKLKVTRILATHAHIDHVACAGLLSRHFGVPFLLNSYDSPMLSTLKEQALEFGYRELPDVTADGLFAEGTRFQVGSVSLVVLGTPGHTPGSSCFLVGERDLFTGDTLFAGSIGRTDFPGGSPSQMEDSLKRLASLPGETSIYPGHGGTSTIGNERAHNPFLLSLL